MVKKAGVLIFCLVMGTSLCACGSTSQTANQSDVSVTSETIKVETVEEITEETTVANEITTVAVGQSLETDNFKMVVESMQILDEYSFSTYDNSLTVEVGVEKGYKLLIVQGTIENTGMVTISDYSFARRATINENYIVEGYANNEVALYFERQNCYELDPYTEMRFDLCVNIPEKLAAQFETAKFTLGYNNDMSFVSISYDMNGTETVEADNWFEIVQ